MNIQKSPSQAWLRREDYNALHQKICDIIIRSIQSHECGSVGRFDYCAYEQSYAGGRMIHAIKSFETMFIERVSDVSLWPENDQTNLIRLIRQYTDKQYNKGVKSKGYGYYEFPREEGEIQKKIEKILGSFINIIDDLDAGKKLVLSEQAPWESCPDKWKQQKKFLIQFLPGWRAQNEAGIISNNPLYEFEYGKIIFDLSATTVLWRDGTKSVLPVTL